MQIKLCWFNQRWNIYLYTNNQEGDYYKDSNTWSNNPLQTVIRDENPEHSGEYRLRTYEHPQNIPVYGFGFFADDPKKRPGHGREWSSNSTTINQVFNTNLTEVALDNISIAVPRDWLEKVMGDKVIWTPCRYYGKSITEVPSCPNPKWDQWIEI